MGKRTYIIGIFVIIASMLTTVPAEAQPPEPPPADLPAAFEGPPPAVEGPESPDTIGDDPGDTRAGDATPTRPSGPDQALLDAEANQVIEDAERPDPTNQTGTADDTDPAIDPPEQRPMTDGPGPDPLAAPAEAAAGPGQPQYVAPEPGTEATIAFPALDDVPIIPTALAPFLRDPIADAIRYKFVDLDVDAFADDLDAASVVFELYDDAIADVTTAHAPSPGAGDTTYYRGDIDSDTAIITISEMGIIGQIWVDGSQFQIKPVPGHDGLHVVLEVGGEFPEEGHSHDDTLFDNGPSGLTVQELARAGDQSVAPTAIVGTARVDVMVAYDATAFAYYDNSVTTTQNAIAAMINQANGIYANSDISQTVALTNIYATGTTPNTSVMQNYLTQLRDKTDGNFDTVHDVRDANGADLLVVLSDHFTDFCGYAYLPSPVNAAENSAYSVTDTNCALGNLTFTHELGHNQCGDHDGADGGCVRYSDDRGYVDAAAALRTVMAINACCARQPVFSNPSITFNGWVPGIAGTSNNARVLEAEACDPNSISGGVANYRAPSGCTPGVAGFNGLACTHATVDEAIDAAPDGATVHVAPGTHAMSTPGFNANIAKNLTIEQADDGCRPVAPGRIATRVVLRPAAGSTGDAVVEINNNATVVLRDITVENGNSAEGTVRVATGTLFLDNTVIRNGNNPSTTLGGGGLRIDPNSAVTMTNNSAIVANNAANAGGGVWINGGSFTIDGIDDVRSNTAGSGGGIAAFNGATVALDVDADVVLNTATNAGGGVYLSGTSTLRLDGTAGTTVGSNDALFGGGIYATDQATITLTRGTVSSNTADWGGGIHLHGDARLDMANAAITGNTATNNGGGVLSQPIGTAAPTIALAAGAHIGANTAGSNGGGVFAIEGTVTALGSGTAPVVIEDNTAGASGGGIYLSAGATGRLDTTRVLRNQATTDGGGIWMASTATNVFELSNCGATTLTFERYCNEFTANTAGDNGGAIMNAGGTLFIEQAGFSANTAGNGNHAIATSGNATATIEASIFLTHPTSSTNAVATFAGTTTATLRAVTFASGPAFAFDADNTATIRVDRVLTTAQIYTGATPYTGACNLTSADGYEPFGNADVILADPAFVTTANSAYVPTDASAIDACTALGRFSDIGDQGAIDTDGTPDARDFEIGAWSSSGPVTCDGATVTIDLNDPNPPAPTAGADVILGTPGPDIISGLGGNDRICAGHGNDTVNGGSGDDRIVAGTGNDTVFGSTGNDTIAGQAGADTIQGNDGNDLLYGDAGNDTMSGNDNADTIYGGTEPDLIYGGNGDDIIFAGAGDDTIVAGAGNDTIAGDSGNDLISGNAGNDTVSGNSGDDTIYGVDGADQLSGADGADTIVGGPDPDLISGGPDSDLISANAGNDAIFGDSGDDTIYGVDGDDTIDGGADNDTILSGPGNDVINGGSGLDLLSGNENDDTIDGGAGADEIYGADGLDTLSGGAGADVILGGAGNDTIDSRDGTADQVSGNAGTDSCRADVGLDAVFLCEISLP